MALYYYVKNYHKQKKIRITNFRSGMSILAIGFILGAILTKYSYNTNLLITSSTKAEKENSLRVLGSTTESNTLPVLSSIPEEIAIVSSTLTPTPTEGITPTPTISLTPTPTESPQENSSRRNVRNNYKIAFLGDSMVDTFGKGYPILSEKLKSRFPKTQFEILNYGVGARDLEYGLFRLTNNYIYMNEEIPALLSQRPDIIFVESFAYNHWSKSQEDLNKQWTILGKIVDTIRQQSNARIVFYTTIGPNSRVYAKGVSDIHWTDSDRRDQTDCVKIYLNNHLNFAKSAHLPFIDAFHPSLNAENEGKLVYINSGDLLHPSNEGHAFVASMIADWLTQNL